MMLRETVARALCDDDGNPCGCTTACKIGLHYADKAIPLILERAAKEVEDNAAVLDHPSVYMGGASNMAKKKAAFLAIAIRDLGKGNE